VDQRPNSEQTALLSRALKSIRANHPAWNVKKLTLAEAGLTCIVGRARTSTLGPLAIRIPRKRILSYTIDQRLSARSLLQQEELLARTVETQGVPVPTVHLEDRGTDFLVSAFIEHDHASASPRDLGALRQGPARRRSRAGTGATRDRAASVSASGSRSPE
jgi:hypothetical protein